MADIPAALVVLQAHLVAAGGALTDPILDVDRGVITTGRMLRYYWAGECPPPHMGAENGRVINGQMVGQRFYIDAAWPLSNLNVAQITAIDIEMQALAGQIRTRLQGDSTLGGNVTDLDLEYGEPDVVTLTGGRHVILHWQLDLAYVEYAISQ